MLATLGREVWPREVGRRLWEAPITFAARISLEHGDRWRLGCVGAEEGLGQATSCVLSPAAGPGFPTRCVGL